MRVSRAPAEAIHAHAARLDLRLKRQWRKGGKYQVGNVLVLTVGDRYSQPGLPFACLHGHEELIESILTEYPDAIIETAVTTYNGLDDFKARQEDVWEELLDRFGEPGCDCE